MNPGLGQLQPYPFERLRALLAGIEAPPDLTPIGMSIGEPRHPPPAFVVQTLRERLDRLGAYPATRGLDVLRAAIANSLSRACLPPGSPPLDPDREVLPVNGTREALFACAQAVVRAGAGACVALPNPGYQIYEGATLLAGASPHYLPLGADGLPDLAAVPAAVWERCQLLYLCTPGNPTGAILPLAALHAALALAERHDFIIASDECYADLYLDEHAPPPSLLTAARERGSLRRCLIFRSLSKRSNLPGLRAGAVAGDAGLIAQFLQYRTYHGCAMPEPVQWASAAAWADEAHVRENRALYRAKYAAVLPALHDVLTLPPPPAAFYLWFEVPGDDALFVRELYRDQHVTLLPGSYLARPVDGRNPGAHRVRASLVPEQSECLEAARRLRTFMQRYDPASARW